MAKGADTVSEVFGELARACFPSWPADPIAWIEKVRWLSVESSREVGPFRFDRTPYLTEPQRAILDSDTPEVVLEFASQTGKTELLLNSILFWSVNDPGPALLVAPDWNSARSLSADRIRPAFRDAKIEAHEQPQRGGPGSNDSTFRMLLAGRMPLTAVPASSAAGLAQRPIKFLIGDEVSRFPTTAKGRTKEGDPIALARVRLSTYGDSAKSVFCSSPTEAGQCRISELFEDSTREKYHSRCPGCSHLQIIRLHECDFESVTCRCLECGQAFNQDQWQNEKGEWIAENPGARRRGFWLNVFVSPFVRWETVFAEFREATRQLNEGDSSLYRAILQTRLCENFSERVVHMSQPEILMARRETYPAEVPDDRAKMLVCAIDTQDTWLEYLITALGARGEMWALECGEILGRIETDAAEMYQEIDRRLLSRTWKRPDGRPMAIVRALQDSGGHATHVVYKKCQERARIMMPYRGSADVTGPYKRGTDTTTHSRLIQGGADYLKNLLQTHLAIEEPGPGFVHFNAAPAAGFDQEFFLQLCSERREKRRKLGAIVTRWVQTRTRNEALDMMCMVLCIAEMYRAGLDSMEPRVVTSEKDQAQTGIQWGARKMQTPDRDLIGSVAHQPGYSTGAFGALKGSGIL